MKHGAWVVMALLVGLVLGSWGPRSDLRRAKEEIEDMKRRMARGWTQGGEVEGVRQMLRIPGNDAVRKRAVERAKRTAPSARTPVGRTEPAQSSSQSVAHAAVTTNADAGLEWDADDIERAAKFWNTRAAIARNSFITNAKLDTKQTDRFDTLVAAMNLRLETGISNWVQGVKAKGAANTEDGIRLMNDLSTAVVLTYDEMDRSMPPDWRKQAGDKFELVNFVDPVVAAPLMDVEGLMKDRGSERGRHGPHGEVSITIGESYSEGPGRPYASPDSEHVP